MTTVHQVLRRAAGRISRLSPEQARERLDRIRAEGVTIDKPTVRELTGGYASQSINIAIVRYLAARLNGGTK